MEKKNKDCIWDTYFKSEILKLESMHKLQEIYKEHLQINVACIFLWTTIFKESQRSYWVKKLGTISHTLGQSLNLKWW